MVLELSCPCDTAGYKPRPQASFQSLRIFFPATTTLYRIVYYRVIWLLPVQECVRKTPADKEHALITRTCTSSGPATVRSKHKRHRSTTPPPAPRLLTLADQIYEKRCVPPPC
jgi:hypothetical protein